MQMDLDPSIETNSSTLAKSFPTLQTAESSLKLWALVVDNALN